MAVGVRVVAEGEVEAILEGDQLGHRMRRRAIHADPAVPVERHEAEGGVHLVVDDLDVEPVSLRDRVPERDARPAQRIDADAQPGAADGVHVDHRDEIATYAPT